MATYKNLIKTTVINMKDYNITLKNGKEIKVPKEVAEHIRDKLIEGASRFESISDSENNLLYTFQILEIASIEYMGSYRKRSKITLG